jgi:hypothetical protein
MNDIELISHCKDISGARKVEGRSGKGTGTGREEVAVQGDGKKTGEYKIRPYRNLW